MTRDQLREHLDRKPSTPHALHCPRRHGNFEDDCECSASGLHRFWFDGDEYLGEVSARTGPDAVPAVQPCGCGQCRAPKEP